MSFLICCVRWFRWFILYWSLERLVCSSVRCLVCWLRMCFGRRCLNLVGWVFWFWLCCCCMRVGWIVIIWSMWRIWLICWLVLLLIGIIWLWIVWWFGRCWVCLLVWSLNNWCWSIVFLIRFVVNCLILKFMCWLICGLFVSFGDCICLCCGKIWCVMKELVLLWRFCCWNFVILFLVRIRCCSCIRNISCLRVRCWCCVFRRWMKYWIICLSWLNINLVVVWKLCSLRWCVSRVLIWLRMVMLRMKCWLRKLWSLVFCVWKCVGWLCNMVCSVLRWWLFICLIGLWRRMWCWLIMLLCIFVRCWCMVICWLMVRVLKWLYWWRNLCRVSRSRFVISIWWWRLRKLVCIFVNWRLMIRLSWLSVIMRWWWGWRIWCCCWRRRWVSWCRWVFFDGWCLIFGVSWFWMICWNFCWKVVL